VFISVNNSDKQTVLPIRARSGAARVHAAGHARHGGVPARARLDVDVMYKVNEGGRTSPITSSTGRSTSS
jgi:hypothetical protein